MSKTFLDTNVIVYANDGRDLVRQRRDIECAAGLMRAGTGVSSSQVMQEYASVALSRLGQKGDVVQRQLALLEALEVIPVTPDIVRRSVEVAGFYRITFWDACILAAAEKSGCTELLSEDLNSGQFYSGIRVVNPFTS